MKNSTILFFLLIGISFTSFSQKKYDFSKINSKDELTELLSRVIEENKAIKIDTTDFIVNKLKVKGMHYAGIPIKTILVTDDYNNVKIIADTLAHSAKKLLEVVEAKNGLAKPIHIGDEISFNWNSETQNNELTIMLINGKHIASLGDEDLAWLTITFKTP